MINTTNEGSKLYLYSITSVAILGGLLFGYDTAVISGAEKGLEAFFLSASDFQYNKVMHGITSSSALIGCVLGGAFSGIFASRLGRRNSLRLAIALSVADTIEYMQVVMKDCSHFGFMPFQLMRLGDRNTLLLRKTTN